MLVPAELSLSLVPSLRALVLARCCARSPLPARVRPQLLTMELRPGGLFFPAAGRSFLCACPGSRAMASSSTRPCPCFSSLHDLPRLPPQLRLWSSGMSAAAGSPHPASSPVFARRVLILNMGFLCYNIGSPWPGRFVLSVAPAVQIFPSRSNLAIGPPLSSP
ncbi:uncharacterized protein [Zea mays]|uniref:Uncharacterized protein n=1 Tax=Zea mays TaxID=4577 RepID=C0HG78_MAIZE|nr:uncharacterized protein LOC100381469 [Zea mays]XP_023157983.1 uncharacterized protein LOC100381469 isoform X1 [Zea mays]XP_023157984.1 uncharacterized protein LOC100381469 isoform X1 [Zea mays]ACN26031.1 unknown [Zea mays]|eukprot:NP_001167776.1 uncharacterized protein LOC100381469 [Zea mays]